MEFEDFHTNISADASAMKKLISELAEAADESNTSQIHTLNVLIEHQLLLLEKMAEFIKQQTDNCRMMGDHCN